jgi:RNA polymerase sigma-B factor
MRPLAIPRTDTTELFTRWQHDADRDAGDELIRRFLPLTRQLARRYAGGHEPFDDLMQVASLGLVKALARFDPNRGTAFSSFAVPTILASSNAISATSAGRSTSRVDCRSKPSGSSRPKTS